jgi:predicted nucleic-acid-binding protein
MRVAADTNVLVRYLTWDDEPQGTIAAAALESAETVVIPNVVLCELAWVLKRAYRYSAAEIAEAVRQLIDSRSVEVDRLAVESGLAILDGGGDFADGVIQAEAQRSGCDRLATFDRDFANLLDPGFALLLEAEPGG